MKRSLPTTLLALTAMTLMIMTASSTGFRGLQSVIVETPVAAPASVPNVRISGLASLIPFLNNASNATNSVLDGISLDSFSQNATEEGVIYQGNVTLASDQGVYVTGRINGAWDPANEAVVFNASTFEVEVENENEAPPAAPEGFTLIPQAELGNTAQAQGALDWGVDALIQRAISQYKVPAAEPEYNVTNLILAAYRNTSIGSQYIFRTNLTNALNYKVDANLTVSYRASNQTYRLAGYSFRSYNYPANAIVVPQNVSQGNNNNAGNNGAVPPVVDPSNDTIVTANDTAVVVDTNPVIDNPIVVIPPVINQTEPVANPPNVTAPGNNAPGNNAPVNNTPPAVPVNQTTADGYTVIPADQVAQDSIAQAALQYGANSLIQKAVSQNKIPAANAEYTITNLASASAKKQIIGTSYKFQVSLRNADNIRVEASLTVFYRYSNKAYSLNGYSFRATNLPAGSLSNNSTAVAAPAPVANNTAPAVANATSGSN